MLPDLGLMLRLHDKLNQQFRLIINAIKREGWFNNDLQFHAIERQTKHIDKLSNQKSLRGIGKPYLKRLTNGGPGTYSGVFPREMATGAAVWGGRGEDKVPVLTRPLYPHTDTDVWRCSLESYSADA